MFSVLCSSWLLQIQKWNKYVKTVSLGIYTYCAKKGTQREKPNKLATTTKKNSADREGESENQVRVYAMFSVKQLVLVKTDSENMLHDIDVVISSSSIQKNLNYIKYVYMRNVFWIIIFNCPTLLYSGCSVLFIFARWYILRCE